MRLIFVRHGETIENSTGMTMGHSLGMLTPEGIEQARTLGKHLRTERIDIAFCSDLRHAKDTAAEILHNRNIPTHYSPLLRERSLGVFSGVPLHELYKAEEECGGWDTFHPQTARRSATSETGRRSSSSKSRRSQRSRCS